MNKNTKISDLCSLLDPEFYETLDVENTTDLEPSKQRIEDLVFQKLHTEQQTAAPAGKRGHMKKKTGIVLLIAAILCTLATTAFAMSGGLDYFRSIFGDTADNAGAAIQNPSAAAEDDSYRIGLNSMLTDGYKINLIVSLEPLTDAAAKAVSKTETLALFQTSLEPAPSSSASENTASYTCSELPEFAYKKQRFYHVQLDSLANCTGWTLKLALSDELGGLSLDFKIEGTAAAMEFQIDQAIDSSLTVESVQLSPLGVLVIGNETNASGGLPTPEVDLLFKDGSREELISPMSFDAGDGETVTGGGGAVVGEDPITGPLVIGTHGRRNPDGKVITAGEFGRIIRMDEVESIFVNGVEYKAK